MKHNNTKMTTRFLAFSSMLSALAFVLLTLGTFIPSFDLAAPMLASYAVIVAVCELGRGYAFGVFAAISSLSKL